MPQLNANQLYLATGGTASGEPAPSPKREPRQGPPEAKGGPVVLSSPIGGVVKTTGRESQPEGTCWDALNVLPYDQSGRKRVAQRTGTTKQFPTQLGSGAPVTGLEQLTVATASSVPTVFIESWPYPAGFLTVETTNWALAAGSPNAFSTTGANTLTVDNLGIGDTTATVDGALSTNAAGSYSVTYPVSWTNDLVTDGSMILDASIGGGGTGFEGPGIKFSIVSLSNVGVNTVQLVFYNGGTVEAGATAVSIPGNSFAGTFTVQVTETIGISSTAYVLKLLQGTTVISTLTHTSVTLTQHKLTLQNENINSTFSQVTVLTLGTISVTSGTGGALPLDEKWAYSAGNLTAVTTRWVYEHPHKAPANLWVVPGGGGQVNYVPANAVGLGSFVPLIDYAGPLTGLGPTFTVGTNITLSVTTPIDVNDLVEYQLIVGVPTGGVRYELHVSFNSTDGVTWIPLIVLDIWNKTKLVTQVTHTPSGITTSYSGVLSLTVDESTVGGTTLTVKDRGTTIISQQTPLTPNSVTVAWGVFAIPSSSALLATVTAVQGEFQITPGTVLPDVNVIRSSTLIATAGGFIYVGQVQQGSQNIALAAGQASPPLAPAVLPGIAGIFEKAYLVDSTSIVQLDIPTATVEAYTATAGTAPTGCRFAINWRGRLVLAGDPLNPQNFYMSRSGTPTDWDYSQQDPLAAIIGDASTFGQIGQPITALIPFSDDTMFLGCSHSIWMFQGDPADGGTIINVSDNMGIVANRAWCKDTTGNMYFIGTGGLFHMPSTATLYSAIKPTLISGENWDAFYRNLNPASDYINMTFDSDTHYLHVFITPSSGGQGLHLTIDDRNKGIWPTQYPVMHGPVAVCQFFGDYSANTRSIMLGGLDGYIRKLDDIALDDDGTAIPAYVVLGPVHPTPEASLLRAVTVDFGELLPNDEINNPALWNVSATLRTGATAYDVTEGPPNQQYAVNCPLDGRTKTFRQRLRGGWFTLTISNSTLDTYFAFEQAMLDFGPSGNNRKQR